MGKQNGDAVEMDDLDDIDGGKFGDIRYTCTELTLILLQPK